MDCFRALKLVEVVEQLMADLYDKYAALFADDEEAAAFFYRLHRDELSHRGLVEFQQRLVRKNPKEFGEVAFDLDLFNTAAEKVRYCLRKDASPSLEEAVRIAIDFEGEVAEHLYRTVIAEANPAVQDLVGNLGRQSAVHRQAIHDFAVERGFLPRWERTP